MQTIVQLEFSHGQAIEWAEPHRITKLLGQAGDFCRKLPSKPSNLADRLINKRDRSPLHQPAMPVCIIWRRTMQC